MPGKINYCACKNCGNVFEYDERSFRLKAEKGESRLERCESCRQSHGGEIKRTKTPYFTFRKEDLKLAGSVLPESRFTFRGERNLEDQRTESDFSKIEFGITDKDVLSLYEKLEKNQVVVVTAPTGSGKSTLIACRLIEPPEEYRGDLIDRLHRQGKIAITQPLTAAVQKIPQTNAELVGCGVGPGHLSGLRHGSQAGGREGEQFDRWNIELTVTDGSLRNWIREGKLAEYSVIMVDEAHQRSCNIETILMLLKNELARYPNLKVIISSATVDVERFKNTFEEVGAKTDVLNLDIASKRRHNYYVHYWKNMQPVEGCNCWLCRNPEKRKSFWEEEKSALTESELPETITRLAVKILRETEKGSILVFLHGEAVIEDTAKRIREAKKRIDPSDEIPVLPVYRRVGEEEVNKRFNLKGKNRRVLVTTNIAETSHTLDDVVYAIDSGYIKELDWDPDNEISTLPSGRHSQDGCRQRWGRVGRNQDGYVFCLYTEEEFKQFDLHTPSEITRSPLEEVILSLNAAGITSPEDAPWLVRPEDLNEAESKDRWQKELQRATKAISENRFVDKDGLVTEKAQEIFHVPRSASDIDVLALADGHNCALETAATLFLMTDREGEPRTGDNLYSRGLGLLLWDPDWDAPTKRKIWLLHQGLKIGCRDDLDLVIKIACCFLRNSERNVAQEWADYYQINHQVIEEAIYRAREVVDFHYRIRAREESRDLDINVLERIRQVLTIAWKDKIVDIGEGNPPIYSSTVKDGFGVLSPQCVGNWRKGTKALVAASTERQKVTEDYPRELQVASFMVALTGQSYGIFFDQMFPVDSWIEVEEIKGKTYLRKLSGDPPSIEINFKEDAWLPEEKKNRKIPFDQRFTVGESQTENPQCLWFSQKKAGQARIAEWMQQNGTPVAVLSPFAVSDVFDLRKKRGDSLRVKVYRVVRDPIGRKGWASVRTPRFEIPVELSDLSLSEWGPGLEQIEGRTLTLAVEDFNKDGSPRLSNIEKIIEDLKNLRALISESVEETKVSRRKFIKISGTVIEINKDEGKVIVAIAREGGVVHPFETIQSYVPENSIETLRVNEEIIVQIFAQSGKDRIPVDCLNSQEIEELPKNVTIEEGKILAPFCLEAEDIENWPMRPEAAAFIRRHSWLYCLSVRIRKNPILFKAKASFAPLLSKRKKHLSSREVIGKFIGKGGSHVKQLIGREKGRINVQGLDIYVQSFSEDARKLLCRRITGWFRREFNFSLQWDCFEEKRF